MAQKKAIKKNEIELHEVRAEQEYGGHTHGKIWKIERVPNNVCFRRDHHVEFLIATRRTGLVSMALVGNYVLSDCMYGTTGFDFNYTISWRWF